MSFLVGGSRSLKNLGRCLAIESLEQRHLLAVVIYDDALHAPFQNWSWGTTADFANASPVFSGGNSIAVTHNDAWVGLYLSANGTVPLEADEEIRFHVHGGNTGGRQVRASWVDSGGAFTEVALLSPIANQWTEVVVDFEPFGTPADISGLIFQDDSGGAQATFYLDQLEIVDAVPEQPNDPVPGPSITVDAAQFVGQISDGVYGLNFGDPAFAAEISLPINRWGGNATTRYNYQLDATNIASDYFFENYPGDTPDVSTLPVGSTADIWVNENQQSGAESIITIGTIGWTPNGRDIQGSFPVDIYGSQQAVDPFHPNFGNGIDLDGNFIVNDPSITSNQIDEQFATDWISHLISQHGAAAANGVQYYALDNEPMLWNSTHRDVHPNPASYDEVLAKGISYADAIKQADPAAQTLGPSVWGWTAYFYSALDVAGGGAWWLNPLDRNAHGGQAFIPWYLQEMAAAETLHGKRLLDYLDIHYYPQDEGVALSPAGDLATQQARLRSTRSLWDPTYVDTSWIGETIELVPRMHDWIETYYPGTKLAITEYNWGATDHISGALAQADVLGIYGREGVDIATMWDPPTTTEPAAYAFRMFRNYDGQQDDGSRFGEISLQATTTDVDDVSVFASRRGNDGALTVILVNKSTHPQITPIDVIGAGNQSAEVYTYDSSDLNRIVQQPDLQFTTDEAQITLPAYSITLIELDSAGSTTGDFNNDGVVDVLDIDALCTEVRNGTNESTFDLNGDSRVDESDMDVLILDIVGTLYGDANLDYVVDQLDFFIWNSNKFTSVSSWSEGDFNCDGVVNGRDFLIWNANKFQTAGDQFSFHVDRSAVPEFYSDEITVNATVCNSGDHGVSIDGAAVPYTDHGDGTISLNTSGNHHTVTVRGDTSCADFGHVEFVRLKDDLSWAYSPGFDGDVGLHASIDESTNVTCRQPSS